MTAPSEIARTLGDAWARYHYETLTTIDTVSEQELSRSCQLVADTLTLLEVAIVTGNYAHVPRDTRVQVSQVSGHVMRKHPEFWHLFFEPPTPAMRAILDQVEAARREATERFGPK